MFPHRPPLTLAGAPRPPPAPTPWSPTGCNTPQPATAHAKQAGSQVGWTSKGRRILGQKKTWLSEVGRGNTTSPNTRCHTLGCPFLVCTSAAYIPPRPSLPGNERRLRAALSECGPRVWLHGFMHGCARSSRNLDLHLPCAVCGIPEPPGASFLLSAVANLSQHPVSSRRASPVFPVVMLCLRLEQS